MWKWSLVRLSASRFKGDAMSYFRAIQAATDFPDAQILAVDLAPLVAITLPKNMDFQVVDVTQTLPFEEKAFDIVHARLLLMHVPNGKDVLERAAKLVKPGGWLMVEDFDIRSLIENSGPVVSRVIDTWNGILRARGADGEIGRKMKIIIHDTGMYSQPETCMIPIPICKKDKAPPKNLMRLGAVFNMTVKKLVDDWAERFSAEGISQESAEEYKKEIETDFEDVTVNMHFVWAQRL